MISNSTLIIERISADSLGSKMCSSLTILFCAIIHLQQQISKTNKTTKIRASCSNLSTVSNSESRWLGEESMALVRIKDW